MNTLKRIFAVALLLLIGVPFDDCSAANSRQRAQARYDAAAAILFKQADYAFIDDTPEARKALDQAWDAMEDWTVDYLRSHPRATPKQIEGAALPLFDIQSPLVATALSPGLLAVGAQYGELGTVFLIGKSEGHFAVLWDTRRAATKYAAEFPLLADWLSNSANIRCHKCRALSGTAHPLPPDALGRGRFYINATYAQGGGATQGAQLSFWTWDSKTATPLLVKSYIFVADDEEIVRLDGDLLKVRVKRHYKMFGAYGCCAGREMDWIFRIGPERIDDLGLKPVMPELDTIDDVLFRLWKGKSAKGLASPEALKVLAGVVMVAREDKQKHPIQGLSPDLDPFGTGTFSIDRGSRGATVCIVSDEPYMRLHVRPKTFYIDSAEIPVEKPKSACGHGL